MRRRKLYSDDKLNRAIGEYYNGTKKVIAVTELMNVCLNSVEASFKTCAIETYDTSVHGRSYFVDQLFFCFVVHVVHIFIGYSDM